MRGRVQEVPVKCRLAQKITGTRNRAITAINRERSGSTVWIASEPGDILISQNCMACFAYARANEKIRPGAPGGFPYRFGKARLERDDFGSNRHPALSLCLSMSFFAKPPPFIPSPACGGGIKGGGCGTCSSAPAV